MLTIPSQLESLQPNAFLAWKNCLEKVLPFVDREVLNLVTLQLKATLERRSWHPPEGVGEYELAAVRFADQFAVEVSRMSKSEVARLVELAGHSKVNALANATYLVDMTLRLELVVPVLLDPRPGAYDTRWVPGEAGAGADADRSDAVIAGAIADFAAEAVLADGIADLTGELVRLRCAQIHNCRLCGSLRQRSALAAGLDETMVSRVSDWASADFNTSEKAALGLVDVLTMFPADADRALREELHAHFSPAQIAELCLDVVKWSQQKALVALEMDAPTWNDIRILDFDERGNPQFLGPVEHAPSV